MNPVILCQHQQIKLHPKNIRIYYPPEAVEEMARSLRVRGNIDALQIVADPADPGKYLVCNGNLRLMAARQLGEACPPLKCEVIEADEAEQLLLMAATGLHYPKDPVSEGRHFRRLIEAEGLTVEAIAARTGISRATIDARLRTGDLEDEIQRLMAEGRLSADLRVTRALLSLPDPANRLKLARRFAHLGTSIVGIQRACRFAVEQARRLGQPVPEKPRRQPALRVLKKEPAADDGRLSPDAAEVIWLAAEKTLCEGCRLDGLKAECWTCPGPYEFINHVVDLAESRRAEAVREEEAA